MYPIREIPRQWNYSNIFLGEGFLSIHSCIGWWWGLSAVSLPPAMKLRESIHYRKFLYILTFHSQVQDWCPLVQSALRQGRLIKKIIKKKTIKKKKRVSKRQDNNNCNFQHFGGRQQFPPPSSFFFSSFSPYKPQPTTSPQTRKEIISKLIKQELRRNSKF